MDLLYLIKVLWEKRWYLLIVPLISFLAAFFFTAHLPKEYVSKAQLSTGFTSKEGIDLYNEDFNLRESSVKFINVIQTMKSPLVINLLSYELLLNEFSNKGFRKIDVDSKEKFSIENHFQFKIAEKEKIADLLRQKLEKFKLLDLYHPDEKIIFELLKFYNYDYNTISESLQVYQIGGSDFIEVTYKSNNPFLSAFVVNTISKEYIRYHNYLNNYNTTNSLEFYTTLLKEKKDLLDNKNQEVNQIKQQNNVFHMDESQYKLEQIKEYELKVNTLQEELRTNQMKLEALNLKLSNLTNPEGNSNQRILNLRQRINQLQKVKMNELDWSEELETTLVQLRKELTYEMSKLSVKDHDEKTLLEELKKEKEDLLLKTDISKSNISEMETSLRRLKSSASGLASKEALIAAKEKEAEKAMEEYLQVLNKYNEAQNKSLISNTSIKLMIPGQPSQEPISSKRLIITGLITFSSFFLLLFMYIFFEYIDTSLKTPGKFKITVDLKLLGSLNRVNLSNIGLYNLFKQNHKNEHINLFKEYIRKIRFELLKGNGNIILVTSNKIGEGKSFLILCLAYSLNLLKKKILIIDTNFKNNALTNQLLPHPIDPSHLLETNNKLLTNNAFENANFQKSTIISNTAFKNIDLIGSVPLNESPSEVFSGKVFNELLLSLSKKYDFILLEGPALNEYSDTKELVTYVDKVISVFDSETNINQNDKESINYLKSLNGKFVGSVLNKVEFSNIKY